MSSSSNSRIVDRLALAAQYGPWEISLKNGMPSPRRRRLILAFSGSIAFGPQVFADNAPFAGLKRWGSGEFRRFGFLVYAATLWAGDDPQRPPLALRLDYKRNLAGSAIAEASVKEMRPLGSNEASLQHWGDQMAKLFPDVKPGDFLIGQYRTEGAVFTHNDRLLGEILDEEFARQFFGIWLDPRTSAPELRAQLLKRPTE